MNKCLYVPGNYYIEGFIVDGATEYSKTPVEDYIKDNPGTEIWEFDLACEEIQKVAKKKFITDWKEITKEKWWEMLEVLPPERWQTCQGVEIFRMSERDFGNITGHYARIGDRYYFAAKECGDYSPLIKELRTIV